MFSDERPNTQTPAIYLGRVSNLGNTYWSLNLFLLQPQSIRNDPVAAHTFAPATSAAAAAVVCVPMATSSTAGWGPLRWWRVSLNRLTSTN